MYERKLDLIASICFIIVGIIFRVEAGKIRALSFGSLGGDFFPKTISSLLIILSVLWFVTALKSFIKYKGNTKTSTNVEAQKGNSRKQTISIAIYLLLFCLLVYLLSIIGFVLFSLLLSMLTYAFLKTDLTKKDFVFGILYSIVITAIMWFVFVETLGLVMPRSQFF